MISAFSRASARCWATRTAPADLPGKGLAQHDFFYAGEAKTRDMYLVRAGKVAWAYHDPAGKGEISDAVLLSNGNILFTHQFGVSSTGFTLPAGLMKPTALRLVLRRY
jgi:hypothetical protein